MTFLYVLYEDHTYMMNAFFSRDHQTQNIEIPHKHLASVVARIACMCQHNNIRFIGQVERASSLLVCRGIGHFWQAGLFQNIIRHYLNIRSSADVQKVVHQMMTELTVSKQVLKQPACRKRPISWQKRGLEALSTYPATLIFFNSVINNSLY